MALTSDYDPKATDKKDEKEKRVNGQEKSGVDTMNYGPKKLKDSKQPKDQNKFTDNPQQDGEHNDKKSTTGNNTGKDGKSAPGGTEFVQCPPGKDPKKYLEGIAKLRVAQGYVSPVKVECKDKTDTQGGGATPKSNTPPSNTPNGAQPLPLIDVAGQTSGAGRMVTNPVDLQNKVVNYAGQQYFNPAGGLPAAPAGYSWQGRDFATLINTANNTAVSVQDTLKLFNQQSQSSARAPSSGGGTNPIAPARFPLSTAISGSVPSTDTTFTPSNVKPGPVTMKDRVSLARAAGFSESQAVLMGAISQAESRGNSLARNPYGRDDSYGLWQINMLGSMGVQRDALFRQSIPGYVNRNSLYNPWINAQAAKIIYNQQGFSAWSTYSSGAYRPFYADAQSGTGLGSSGGGGTGLAYNSIGPAGSSATPIGGGSAAGGGGGSGAGIGSAGGSAGAGGGMAGGGSGSLGLEYIRPQQEGQGGYIAQAAAATIAARTGGLGSLAASNSLLNSNLGGLASNAFGGFGGPAATGSVSPNYNVPNWSGAGSSARDSGVNPAASIGTIPNNSTSLFPTSLNDFSQVGNSLGTVPNAYTNLPTSSPIAASPGIDQNLGAAANRAGIPQTPQGQFGQFGQSITGAGGGGGGSTKKKKEKAEAKEQKSERPTSTTERMNRPARKEANNDKELDKKHDKTPPLPPKRPDELSSPIAQAATRRENPGDEGPENPSVSQAPGTDPHAFVSDMSGAARNLAGGIPGLESLMSQIPNQFLGQFIGGMPAGLQSLLPQGLIPGLNLGPVSLNNMLQLVGGGALGGMAGQLIRSMAGGIPVASMLTQSLQSVPISQVFGSLGQSVGTSAAAIANTLGSITNISSMGAGGIPVNIDQLNKAISYTVASSGSALSIPINTLGIARQVTNNPIGSLVNIAMGGMITNGSVPIVPTNLSGTNAALLSGLSQKIPQEDAQMILTIGQITGLLPPNVRNLIPQVSPSAFGGPTNYVQNSRNNSARQTDPSQIHGDSGGGGGNRLDFVNAEKTNIGDTRNIPYGMKLSEHYTLFDLTKNVAICRGCHPLIPLHGMTVDEVVQNLILLARNILEPIRSNIGVFTINSGFRGDDPTTKRNKGWQRSLHGYGRAADLSWGSSGRISQAQAFAAARLHATENIHEGTWHHIAVAGGTGGKGGNAQTRTPEGNLQQGINTYKGYPTQVNNRG